MDFLQYMKGQRTVRNRGDTGKGIAFEQEQNVINKLQDKKANINGKRQK